MRIFFSVLIIVLAVMIAIRFLVLYFNASGNSKNDKVMNLVGVISSIVIGFIALLFMLGSIDNKDVQEIVSIICSWIWELLFLILLLLILGTAVLLFVAPVFLVPFGIKRKKKAPIIISAVFWGPVYLAILIFFIIYPREYPYVDLWVYGKTSAEIEEKYGEFDYEENNTLYYRCYYWSENGHNYYCIELNDEGEACKIYQDFYDKTWAMGKTYEEIEAKFGQGSYWPDDYYYDDLGYKLHYNEEGKVTEFSTGQFP